MVRLPKPSEMTGLGLYTPAEAARYARVRLQTFNRWFYGDGQGDLVLRPRLGTMADQRVVTFWDLIQAVAVRTLRNSELGSKISLQHIRQVMDVAENEFGIKYPLARRHTLYVFGGRLIIRTDADQLIGMEPGVDLGQIYHNQIVEPFLAEVRFDEVTRMAERWTPLQQGRYFVSLDKDRRFGAPTIEPHGVLVESLATAIVTEGSPEAAADAFDVEPAAVHLAAKYWYDILGTAA